MKPDTLSQLLEFEGHSVPFRLPAFGYLLTAHRSIGLGAARATAVGGSMQKADVAVCTLHCCTLDSLDPVSARHCGLQSIKQLI